MKWTDVYLEACAAELGRAEEVPAAVASGRYDGAEAAADGYLSISVAEDGPAVELAVRAGRRALDRSATPPGEFALVLHSSCGDQGLDHFAPASYVQGRTLGGLAPALEVKQYSNGGLAAVEVGAAYLSALPGTPSALLTTSDVFALPRFDRYRSDKGVVFGDGGTAAVLTRDPARATARVLSTSVISDGEYGAVYIGGDPGATDGIDEADRPGDGPVDLRARREQYLTDNVELLLAVVESMTARQRESVERALADAGTTAADIDRWVLTNVGLTMADHTFRAEVGIPEDRTTWEWGRRVGHIGAADQIAGLTQLIETGTVGPGDRVALCGVGMGFTYACAVVEVLAERDWEPTATAGVAA